MRFEVPQFIEIEDKIFGPFTWKQFVYLMGGVGFAVVTVLTMPIFVFALVGLPLGILSVLLAFYPVNNRPFSNFLESMITFYKNNRIYHWHKKADVVYKERIAAPPSYSRVATIPTQKDGKINSLSRKLEISALQKK